jgi:hypothetical protein
VRRQGKIMSEKAKKHSFIESKINSNIWLVLKKLVIMENILKFLCWGRGCIQMELQGILIQMGFQMILKDYQFYLNFIIKLQL